MPSPANRLESLARDLTTALGLSFRATPAGVAFSGPLALADWSVPLIFDGHLAPRNGSLVPVDFVGHVVWAGLRRVVDTDSSRGWWSCELSAFAAEAILDDCRGSDPEAPSVFDEEVDERPDWPAGHASGM